MKYYYNSWLSEGMIMDGSFHFNVFCNNILGVSSYNLEILIFPQNTFLLPKWGTLVFLCKQSPCLIEFVILCSCASVLWCHNAVIAGYSIMYKEGLGFLLVGCMAVNVGTREEIAKWKWKLYQVFAEIYSNITALMWGNGGIL